MLLTKGFKKLVSLKFSVYCPHFWFLVDLLCIKSFVFYDNVLVLPSSPYLILNLLLLFWCLFYCIYDDSFSAIDLDKLISLLLLHYHLSSSFFSLMFFLFSLSSSKAFFVSALFFHPQRWFSFLKKFTNLLRLALLIRIIMLFCQIFLLELSNIII